VRKLKIISIHVSIIDLWLQFGPRNFSSKKSIINWFNQSFFQKKFLCLGLFFKSIDQLNKRIIIKYRAKSVRIRVSIFDFMCFLKIDLYIFFWIILLVVIILTIKHDKLLSQLHLRTKRDERHFRLCFSLKAVVS